MHVNKIVLYNYLSPVIIYCLVSPFSVIIQHFIHLQGTSLSNAQYLILLFQALSFQPSNYIYISMGNWQSIYTRSNGSKDQLTHQLNLELLTGIPFYLPIMCYTLCFYGLLHCCYELLKMFL